MPTYDYKCNNCNFEFEIIHGMKDKDFLILCPECHKEELKIQYNIAPQGFVRGEPKTLGLLADRNRSAMSKQEYEDKIKKDKDVHKAAIKRRKEMDPTFADKRVDPIESYEAPWRPGTTKPNMKLANLNEKQQKKYIEEGKL